MIYYTVIPLPPITKKNSQRIVKFGNRPAIIPSKQYKDYEAECGKFLKWSDEPISVPVNVKTVFYMPTKRKVDISNLISAAHDILVNYGILQDDHSGIIVSVDGSRVKHDKENPRTEITIEEAKDWLECRTITAEELKRFESVWKGRVRFDEF